MTTPPHPPTRPSLERAGAGGDAACRGAACVGESVIPCLPLSILGVWLRGLRASPLMEKQNVRTAPVNQAHRMR